MFVVVSSVAGQHRSAPIAFFRRTRTLLNSDASSLGLKLLLGGVALLLSILVVRVATGDLPIDATVWIVVFNLGFLGVVMGGVGGFIWLFRAPLRRLGKLLPTEPCPSPLPAMLLLILLPSFWLELWIGENHNGARVLHIRGAVATWHSTESLPVFKDGRFFEIDNANAPSGARTHSLVLRDAKEVPLWCIAGLASLPWALRWARWRWNYTAAVKGMCVQCGYDLRASKKECPECGAAIPSAPAP